MRKKMAITKNDIKAVSCIITLVFVMFCIMQSLNGTLDITISTALGIGVEYMSIIWLYSMIGSAVLLLLIVPTMKDGE